MIRAKFRCMKTSHSWDGFHGAEFRPVYQKKNGQESHNFEENKLFWEATPAGDATLTYQGPHEFVPGAYYYIDMIPDEQGTWRLGEMKLWGSDSYNAGDIWLSSAWKYEPGLRYGEVKMTIKFATTLKLFGAPGSKWDVLFHFAEASDG